MIREGEILAGKYRVEKIIGQGGMGVVVAARHVGLDERVALKFLLPESIHNPELVARFHREGRAAVKIRSEHVARVQDVGTLENGAPYLVMEYLDGVDLEAHVARVPALPVAEAVDYLLQACEAIAEAHALGIVHRDLKPANLFLTRRVDGSVCIKVIDFGIAKIQSDTSPSKDMTKTSAAMGSPLYMSPEQMASAKNAGPSTDIWALGIVLFELLTRGGRAFDGESVAALYIQIAKKPPASLSALRNDLPPGLEQVFLRCVEKDIAARYANIAELARALAPFAPQSALSVERILRTLGQTPAQPTTPPPREIPPTAKLAPVQLPPPTPPPTQPTQLLSTPPATTSLAPPAWTPSTAPPNTTLRHEPSLPPPTTSPPHAHAATAGAWGATAPPPVVPKNSNVVPLVGLALLLLVLAGGGGLYVSRSNKPTTTTSTASAASASVSAAEPPPSATASVAEAREPVPSAAPSHAPAPSPAPRPIAVSVPVAAPPSAVVPAKSATPAVAAPSKPGCNPNYTLDAQGNKHFKPYCFEPQKP